MVPGATVGIRVRAKGGGCETRAKNKMLPPAEGLAGVKEWIIECVKTAGPDACPPLILGVGIGGTLEKAAIPSKKTPFRRLGSPQPPPPPRDPPERALHRPHPPRVGPPREGGDTSPPC